MLAQRGDSSTDAVPRALIPRLADEIVEAIGKTRGHESKNARHGIHGACAIDGEVIEPKRRDGELWENAFKKNSHGPQCDRRERNKKTLSLRSFHNIFDDLFQRKKFTAAEFINFIECVFIFQRPQNARGKIFHPYRLNHRPPAGWDRKHAKRRADEPRKIIGEMVFRSVHKGSPQNRIRHFPIADEFLGDAFCFECRIC